VLFEFGTAATCVVFQHFPDSKNFKQHCANFGEPQPLNPVLFQGGGDGHDGGGSDIFGAIAGLSGPLSSSSSGVSFFYFY